VGRDECASTAIICSSHEIIGENSCRDSIVITQILLVILLQSLDVSLKVKLTKFQSLGETLRVQMTLN